MKKVSIILLLLLIIFSIYAEEIVTKADGTKVILYDDHTWAELKAPGTLTGKNIINAYKSQLRSGIKATDEEIQTACEMLAQGWKYTMPEPKSAKAAWGNGDKRTTWWNGYWYNVKTKQYSGTTPVKRTGGIYVGDNQNNAGSWSNGGCPSMPDIYMFLLSDRGGPL